MKLRVLKVSVIFAMLFLITGIVYAANGDLIVNGNLGVGTSTPAEKAQINGNMIVDGNLGVGTTTPQEKADVNGNMAVSGNMNVNGNIGVGTTTPTKKLHVEGDAYISGEISGATYGYGGMYSTSACYGCRSKNPYTAGCSCPPGFTAQWLQQFPEGNCGWYTGNMYVCNK